MHEVDSTAVCGNVVEGGTDISHPRPVGVILHRVVMAWVVLVLVKRWVKKGEINVGKVALAEIFETVAVDGFDGHSVGVIRGRRKNLRVMPTDERTDYFDAPVDIEVELTDDREPDGDDWEEVENAVRDALDELPWRFEVRSRRTGNELTSLEGSTP